MNALRIALRTRFALALGSVCVLGLAGCSPEPEVARPKNLLVLAVDTLRADELGAYGASPSRTPNLDRLAARSVVFDYAKSHASWTLPSFASMLTSLYTSTHGCWTFEEKLSESFLTFPERFQDAGFATHGVASHIFFNELYGLQQGFDSFDDELAHKRTEEGWLPVTSPIVSEKGMAWLEGRGGSDEPWLLWLHYFDPHLPYLDHENGMRENSGRDERARYRSEIGFTDGQVGRVLDKLEELGMAEDTVVLFVSDHGEAFYEHEGIRRHSYSLYAEELRVPLFLHVPGLDARHVAEPVRTVDLAPTLLALFGLGREDDLPMQGESLVPAMLGQEHRSKPLLAELRLKDGFHANGLVQGRWKLIERPEAGTFELYDIEADPLEMRDVAGEHPDRVRELEAQMRAQIERAREVGEIFEGDGPVTLTPEQREHIEDLGYG